MTLNLVDPFQRKIDYLRLSVTDRCDLRCFYCMKERMNFLPREDLLSLEELDLLSTSFVELGVQKIRVTGGEPLVRKNILSYFKSISRHLETGKLKELSLTTNGTQLSRFAKSLYEFGVRRINISLDSLKTEKFRQITRGGKLEQVLSGIDKAEAVGLRVKINVVALKGTNEDEIGDFVSWCGKRGFDLTFIEVMPMGDFDGNSRISQYWNLKEVRKELEKKWTLEDTIIQTGGPARYSRVKETGGIIGFISPLSHNFCATCNRIRLTCTGQLFMCLGQHDRVDFREIIRSNQGDRRVIKSKILEAISKKPKAHDFDYSQKTVKGQIRRYMSHTGG